jgi:outer membrane protein X
MKKLIFVGTMALVSMVTFAQKGSGSRVFKPFKADIGIGFAIPGGSGSKGGVLFSVEPKYAVLPNLSVGLRFEGAAMINGTNLDNSSDNADFKVQATSSYLVTGDYYFTNNDFKPFAGVGAGLFKTGGIQVTNGATNENTGSATKFGGMVRGGVEYKHIRFGLEYNIIGKTTVAPTTSTSNDGFDIKNSYLGVKFSFVIGGGRL